MKLFLGLIFILLDFKIEIGSAMIGLLPDFIGFWLVMKALEKKDDPWRHLAFGLALVSIVLYAADLFEKSTGAQVGLAVFAIVVQLWTLVMLYHIVGKSERLRMLFPVLVCIQTLSSLLSWLPLVGTVCTVADTVMAVCFLAAAYKPMITE